MEQQKIDKLTGLGFRRWQKDAYDRLYIGYKVLDDWAIANNEQRPYAWMNRFERQNGKIWIETETGEICTKDIESANEIKSIVEKYIG